MQNLSPLAGRPAGDSIVLSPIFPGAVEVVVPAPASSLLRSTSIAYLSSYHSGDDIRDAALESLPLPAVWEAPASKNNCEFLDQGQELGVTSYSGTSRTLYICDLCSYFIS